MNSTHATYEQNQTHIALLSEFIESNPDAREFRRALAVKLALMDKKTHILKAIYHNPNQLAKELCSFQFFAE